MFFDIQISPAQAKKLGEWVDDGPSAAQVLLCVDDSMLVAGQGDDKTAWDADGGVGSEEYISLAPVDGSGPGRDWADTTTPH